MKKAVTVFVGLLLSALVAQSALAERLVLRMGNAHMRGQSVIRLKQEIKRQYPHVRIRDLDLRRVRLVAKTRHGRGTASLRVGRWQSYDRRVYGTPRDFHRRAPRTFDRVDFRNDAYNSQGPWQISLRGNFKVRRVVLFVDSMRRRPPRRPRPPHRGQTQIIECNSWGKRHQTCRARGVITSVRLITEKSSGRHCRAGSGYGYRGRRLWVNNGCRGVFEVTFRRGRRGRFSR